jgi:hypothetical protein
MPLVAIVQVGSAIAPQTPQFNQGEEAACVVTFFDSVTQIQTDPTGSAITAETQNPDGSTTTIPCTRTAQGAYAANIPFLQVGTYGIQFNASQGSQSIELQSQATVVASYVSPASLTDVQWTFVSASSTPQPYQAVPGSPFIAVDLRAGPVTIEFWAPSDGDTITIKDWYNLWGTQPLGLNAGPGYTLEVPGDAGTYAQTANATGPAGTAIGFEQTWKYSLQAGAWGRVSP